MTPACFLPHLDTTAITERTGRAHSNFQGLTACFVAQVITNAAEIIARQATMTSVG